MAAIDSAKQFWKTMRSVSVPEIGREAGKTFSLAVVGDMERRNMAIARLFPDAAPGQVVPNRSLIASYDSTARMGQAGAEAGSYDIVIDAGGGRDDEVDVNAPVFSVEELGGWDRTLARIVEQRPDLALSLARRFPGLRPMVAERIIKETAMANAEFAMLNALPGVVPIVAPILPAAAIGDIFLLTKNQAMMMFRLAAVYGLPLDVRARSRDLAPLVGNAFGWRAIARELLGFVPGGVGLAAKGVIAYAGTAALGKALQKLYETGEQPTRVQFQRLYNEARDSAREALRKRLPAARRRPRAALPPGEEPGPDADQ